MSYWNALMVSGSWPLSASRPPCGIENGLCEKSTFLSSSLYSYIGKSTIQASSKRSLSIRFSSSPSFVRARPENFQNFSGSPATKNAASPSLRPSWVRTAAIRTQLGLKEGDAAFFVAGDPEKFWKFSGLARTKLGEELNLIDKERFELAWIVDFPMYEYNEEDKKVDFSHNPFSMPQGGLEALQTQDPLTIKAFQYDIACNGYEIASGGVRNHR